MRHQTNDFILLSASLSRYDNHHNNNRSELLETMLKDIGATYQKGLGVYKNEAPETCFLVRFDNKTERDLISSFGLRTFSQESVLIREGNHIYLLFDDGTTKGFNGVFQQITESEAIDHTGMKPVPRVDYTKLGNKFWTVK